MIKTILIIVLSVSLFGIIFFLYIKKILKKQLNYLVEKEKSKKRKKN
tara:strand:+ start:171 stop:311 length:141 start_codon:yes stop_codon:yes gene_type:complete